MKKLRTCSWILRLGAATAGTLVFAAIQVTSAHADGFATGCPDFWSDNEPCRQDNGGIVWCQAPSLNGVPDLKATTTWAINAITGPTDLTASQSASCSASSDIQFKRADLGFGVIGEARCTDYDSSLQRCMAADVFQDLGNQLEVIDDPEGIYPYSNGSTSDGELVRNFKAIWCHEAGHTIGLVHHPVYITDRDIYYDGSTGDREQDCMVNGHVEFDQNWLRLNPHHRVHVNNAY